MDRRWTKEIVRSQLLKLLRHFPRVKRVTFGEFNADPANHFEQLLRVLWR